MKSRKGRAKSPHPRDSTCSQAAAPSRWHLSLAAGALANSGIIAYPTEAVFGLGCDPLNPLAVERLIRLKRRRREKGLILIASTLKQLRPFLRPLDEETQKTLNETWPGPVTWVLPAATYCPDWLTGGTSTLAVRVTDHPVCRALCDYWQGPLVSTSANVSGHPPIKRRLLLLKHFHDAIDYIVPGELGNLKKPTEIRDMLSKAIIRPS